MATTPRSPYRGRFAPTPTGPLHFGSLVAATASYLCAREARGSWLVRIEDLDPPREAAGSRDQILRALECFGFEWNESIVRQSERGELYEAALQRLLATGNAFPCSCSRTEIVAAGATGGDSDELRYPGWCRNGIRAPDRPLAIRFRTPAGPIAFEDGLQGPVSSDVAAQVGDFVIRRRDGWFAYQLAVVVDDAAQGITSVVRGADLLNSTPRQLLLQRALGLPTPAYAHMPVATDRNGVKLSKSAGAAALDLAHPGDELWRALWFLRQGPPSELRHANPADLWSWAIAHWTLAPVRGLATACAEDAACQPPV